MVADKKARNGYFHTLNHPLLPPGTIFEELYLFPDTFSTLTSGTMGVHGRHFVDYTYDRNASREAKEPKFKGSPAATFFSPRNGAFQLLPPKLKFFLFSKFGTPILRKLLAYHYLPETLLFSEFTYTGKDDADFIDQLSATEYFNLGDDPSFHREIEAGTGLENATLKIEIDKTKFLPIEGAVKTSIKVNGLPVEVIDVPARNGVVHVIGAILIPPHKHHDERGIDVALADSWENWEDWLPQWAEEVREV